MRRFTRGTSAILLLLAAVIAVASGAHAQGFGDDLSVADVNTGGAQAAPAFPGTKAFWAGTCDLAAGHADEGVPPAAPRDCIDFGVGAPLESPSIWTSPPQWRLAPVTQAGSHPDATAAFWFNRAPSPTSEAILPGASVKSAVLDIPPGFVGDPTAVPRCPAEAARLVPPACPPETQVGIATNRLSQVGILGTERRPVYNVEPRRGRAAEFLIAAAGGVVGSGLSNIPITADVRTDGDFGIRTLAINLPSGFPLFSTQVTLWGVPWAATHDRWRLPEGASLAGGAPEGGLPAAQQVSYNPNWGPIKPFISSLTECSPVNPVTTLAVDSWTKPGLVNSYDTVNPRIDRCERPPFAPEATFVPTSTAPDSAAGLVADIRIPPNDQPPADVAKDPGLPADHPDHDPEAGAPGHWRSADGLATAQLDRTVVRLPEGLSVNPSSAAGLEGCTDAELGVTAVGNPYRFDNEDPFDGHGAECPAGSRIGTAEVDHPGARREADRRAVLGTPKSTDPESGEMFRMFLVLRNAERGLLAKVYGSAVADPVTGKLTATFDRNPRVPVEDIRVELKGGPAGGARDAAALRSRGDRVRADPVDGRSRRWRVRADADPTRSPSPATAPSASRRRCVPAWTRVTAGRAGGSSSPSPARDGQQWLRGLTATLPAGLLASVQGRAAVRQRPGRGGRVPRRLADRQRRRRPPGRATRSSSSRRATST